MPARASTGRTSTHRGRPARCVVRKRRKWHSQFAASSFQLSKLAVRLCPITLEPPGHSEVYIINLRCSDVTGSLVPVAIPPALRESYCADVQRTTAQRSKNSL